MEGPPEYTREPQTLRPEQATLSKQPDRLRVGPGRALIAPAKARRAQTGGGRPGSVKRDPVRAFHRLPARGVAEGFSAQKQGVGLSRLWGYDGTLERIHHELYVMCREKALREQSPTAAIIDSQSVKSAEKWGLDQPGWLQSRREGQG